MSFQCRLDPLSHCSHAIEVHLYDLDIQWLKNHVDIVEDFANFLIQVNL